MNLALANNTVSVGVAMSSTPFSTQIQAQHVALRLRKSSNQNGCGKFNCANLPSKGFEAVTAMIGNAYAMLLSGN